MTQRADPRDPHDGRATQEGANLNRKFRKFVCHHSFKTIPQRCLRFSYPANRNSTIQCEVKKRNLIHPEIQNVGSKILAGPEYVVFQSS